MLQVIPNSKLDEMEAEKHSKMRKAEDDAAKIFTSQEPELVGYIKRRFKAFCDQRQTNGVDDRIVECMRAFKGEYSPAKLQEIRQFGGSEAYAKITTLKCRGAKSALKEIYLGADKPWAVDPTPEPTLPDGLQSAMMELLSTEIKNMENSGIPVNEEQIEERMEQLKETATMSIRAKAKKRAAKTDRKVNDVLVEGKFYEALDAFIADLTVYPYAVMVGPVVEKKHRVKWENKKAVVAEEPQLFWHRVNPADFYWDMSARSFGDAETVEYKRFTRANLNALRGVSGYITKNIDATLEDYGETGLNEWHGYLTDTILHLEDRDDGVLNADGLIHGIQYSGLVQGSTLLEYGVKKKYVPEELTDYHATIWVIANRVIKAQITANPHKRHNYFKDSYETMPGAAVGMALPELIDDLQDAINACLRSLINNMAIASGPQVSIDETMLVPTEDGDTMYPWKRWRFQSDPAMPNSKPIEFFQPNSNASELLGVYDRLSAYADEVSAIPKFMTGNQNVGGAGRTASGLSMLMNSANKVLQEVATNVDRNVVGPCIQMLYDTLLLTDTSGEMNGDEKVVVKGVKFAQQQETQRLRSLEFLQLTGNPIDMQIMGTKGRAAVLKEVADKLGMDHTEIIPDPEAAHQEKPTPDLNPAGSADAPPPGAPNPAGDRPEAPMSGMMRGPSGQAS